MFHKQDHMLYKMPKMPLKIMDLEPQSIYPALWVTWPKILVTPPLDSCAIFAFRYCGICQKTFPVNHY